jgi:hypothetical protein
MAKKKRRNNSDGENKELTERKLNITVYLVEKGYEVIAAGAEDKLRYIVSVAEEILKDKSIEFTDHKGDKMILDRKNPTIICAGRVLDLDKTLIDNDVHEGSTLYIQYKYFTKPALPATQDGEGCIVS